MLLSFYSRTFLVVCGTNYSNLTKPRYQLIFDEGNPLLVLIQLCEITSTEHKVWYNCEKMFVGRPVFFSGWCYIDFSLKSMRPQGQIKISPSKGFLTDGRSSSSTDRWLHWQGGSGGTHHRSHSHSFWSGWKDPLQTLQQMWLDRRFADDLQQEGRATWNQQVNVTRDRWKFQSMRDLSIEKSNGRGSREGLHNQIFTTRNRVEQRRKTPRSWSIMHEHTISFQSYLTHWWLIWPVYLYLIPFLLISKPKVTN